MAKILVARTRRYDQRVVFDGAVFQDDTPVCDVNLRGFGQKTWVFFWLLRILRSGEAMLAGESEPVATWYKQGLEQVVIAAINERYVDWCMLQVAGGGEAAKTPT